MNTPANEVVYINGELLPSTSASLSVFDRGVLFGDGVFDAMFAKYGYLFRLENHLTRLQHSLTAIGLRLPQPATELGEAIIETLRANRLSTDAYIKVIVTRGIGRQPLLDPRDCIPNVVIIAKPYLSQVAASRIAAGVKAKIVSIRHTGAATFDPRIKSLNYLPFVLAKLEAQNSGCDEALLMDHSGNVCEAAGYNVFVVTEGTVKTPGKGILEGITRATVIELCAALGICIEICSLSPYDIYTADEVFLSSSAGGLVPLSSVDGREVSSEVPGKMFSLLAMEYDRLLRSGRMGTSLR
jgi:branched-chain amino acid aminotransferase